MIEVTGLSKSFEEVKAVKELSLVAPNGMITGLLGPNGAGKSTTMRMIGGLLSPDTGVVAIDGIDLRQDLVGAQKLMGVLPDKRGLYQRLTARENIRYYGRLRGMSGEALEKRITQLGSLLEMDSFLERRTAGFSSGQKVKVALARVLVHEPENVILDEPTLGLDVMSTRAMRELIGRLRDEGHTILFSSHIMQEVALLCERIVIIAEGRVAAEGTAAELVERSGEKNLEDAFVSFIGSAEGLK